MCSLLMMYLSFCCIITIYWLLRQLHSASYHLLLHFIEQFAGGAAWVDEADVIGACGDQQDTQG